MIMNNTLRILREQNNYSQAAVASYLGISRQMYIKYETGAAIPPVKVVTDLSNFYRVPYDVIIEDKLNSNQYDENNMSDKDAPYYDESNNTSYYLQAIMKMLPKLKYKEQLIVLEKLAGMVQLSTEYELKPKKKTSFYEELEKLNNKYHLRSDGKGWTRDELYER